MNCVVCGSKKVYDEIVDQSYLFNNVPVLIAGVHRRRCDDCKESMLTFSEAVRVSKLHLAHNRKAVNLPNPEARNIAESPVFLPQA